MLDPAVAEQIFGSEDTAITSEVAHRSAQIIVGLDADQEYGEEISQRLIAVINTQGVDTVAELWSRSPANTLPGTLWRLYLIMQWWQKDPEMLRDKYRRGMKAEVRPELADQQVDLERTMNRINELLLSRYDGSLPELLADVAVMLRTLAAGAAEDTWDNHNPHATITERKSALLATATEIEEACELAKTAKLD